MSKRKDGVFSLLRHIIGNQKKIIKEQEKQTKMLQAIESSKEQNITSVLEYDPKTGKGSIHESIKEFYGDF